MSKFVNVSIDALLNTDFYIEVDDNATVSDIETKAKQEVLLPNKYPEILDKFVYDHFHIKINGVDSLLKSWNIKEIKYIINDEGTKA